MIEKNLKKSNVKIALNVYYAKKEKKKALCMSQNITQIVKTSCSFNYFKWTDTTQS